MAVFVCRKFASGSSSVETTSRLAERRGNGELYKDIAYLRGKLDRCLTSIGIHRVDTNPSAGIQSLAIRHLPELRQNAVLFRIRRNRLIAGRKPICDDMKFVSRLATPLGNCLLIHTGCITPRADSAHLAEKTPTSQTRTLPQIRWKSPPGVAR
jgi:hypothetical protein